jgi:hypothetical protein
MWYVKLNRQRIIDEHEGLSFGGVGKKLGEEWRALDARRKQKYEDMSVNDSRRKPSSTQ